MLQLRWRRERWRVCRRVWEVNLVMLHKELDPVVRVIRRLLIEAKVVPGNIRVRLHNVCTFFRFNFGDQVDAALQDLVEAGSFHHLFEREASILRRWLQTRIIINCQEYRLVLGLSHIVDGHAYAKIPRHPVIPLPREQFARYWYRILKTAHLALEKVHYALVTHDVVVVDLDACFLWLCYLVCFLAASDVRLRVDALAAV